MLKLDLNQISPAEPFETAKLPVHVKPPLNAGLLIKLILLLQIHRLRLFLLLFYHLSELLLFRLTIWVRTMSSAYNARQSTG